MTLMLLCVAATALAAQGKAPADSGRSAEWQHRREEFRQRRAARVKQELGLSDDQAAKLHATEQRFFDQRRSLMEKGRAIREGLRGQLQPGVAANADSVRKLLDARQQLRATVAQLDRDQDRDLAAYLTPVQRARYELMHERMMMRARMRGQSGPHQGPRRWGPGQGDGPGHGRWGPGDGMGGMRPGDGDQPPH
jgi:Spy/CpxP family protein refolding chaperone